MSKYTTVRLQFDDYDAFYSACDEVGLVQDEAIVLSSHNHCLVDIGTLYQSTGETTTDDDSNESDVMEALDGYHVNLRYKTSVGLEAYEISVDSPMVKFAGE